MMAITALTAPAGMVVFTFTMVYAGLTDLTTMAIKNRLVLLLLLAYVVLAPLVGMDVHTLARAMNPELSKHLPSALALLETARRRLLLNPKT